MPSADVISSLTGRSTIVFDAIPSTNTALIDAIKNGDTDARIFAAVSQTSGKGRLGRSFSSERGGIYFSFNFSMPVSRAQNEARLVTPLAGVAVTDALTKLYGVCVGLKWVNDIIADGKKLGGVLSEAVTVGNEAHITVGIGINAVNVDFPETATSLSRICGKKSTVEFDASAVISETVNAFFSRLPHIAEIHRDYSSRIIHIGSAVRLHRFDGTPDVLALCLDVNDDCELVVKDENGIISNLSSGEVSIIIKNQ